VLGVALHLVGHPLGGRSPMRAVAPQTRAHPTGMVPTALAVTPVP
jgi:hypothetical protein